MRTATEASAADGAAGVLLVAPQWIGDAVMAQPLAARLAAGGARVVALALPSVAPVLRAMPGVAEVVEVALAHGRLDWRLRRRVAASLRARRLRAAYVLGNNVKSRLIPWLARIPLRIGYRGEAAGWLLTRAVPEPPPRSDMRARYLALAAADSAPGAPELVADAATVAETLQRFELAAGAIALCPGAEYGGAKRWPLEHFAAFARLAQRDGLSVLVLGAPRDRDAGDAIVAAAPGVRNLCGATDMAQAIALLASTRGVLSNDSGLMHVAAALGRPTLGLYGSTDPRHTPPSARRSATIWLQLDCSPCFARECPLGTLACLKGIAPERAWTALRGLIEPD